MDIFACIVKLGYKATVRGNSYEGIKPHELETRPIPTLKELEAVWPDVQAEMEKDRAASDAKAQLNEIDLKSIRSLREWLFRQSDCPEFIREYEQQAVDARMKIR